MTQKMTQKTAALAKAWRQGYDTAAHSGMGDPDRDASKDVNPYADDNGSRRVESLSFEQKLANILDYYDCSHDGLHDGIDNEPYGFSENEDVFKLYRDLRSLADGGTPFSAQHSWDN